MLVSCIATYAQINPVSFTAIRKKAIIGGKDSAVFIISLRIGEPQDTTTLFVPEYGKFKANTTIQFMTLKPEIKLYDRSAINFYRPTNFLASFPIRDVTEIMNPAAFEMPDRFPDTYLEGRINNPSDFEKKISGVMSKYFRRGYVRSVDESTSVISYSCNYVSVGKDVKYNFEASFRLSYSYKRGKSQYYRIQFVSRMNRNGDKEWETPGNQGAEQKTRELMDNVKSELNP
ncbi:hypothetical protein SAMN05444410_10823 [Hydrobacter penzbergensis]|uniref:Uncharacterized protein n=2 Tax=Hydrobacter penzbergensis TaxID=1235997 RepID=A0A8X8IGC2_9BACT|nr:hypothetical protein SAMN05444410_10823 [Hydrobacter penzbergensis]